MPEQRNGLLVLSRRRDEVVMLGDDIEVMVVDIRGDKVRLGFRAPRSLPVHRREVWEARQREKELEGGKPAVRMVEED